MERQKLKAARLDRHWTLAQAAEQVGVDVNTLSRWERGKTRPHGYNIVRLCEVYEKTSAELGLESRQEMTDAVEQVLLLSSLETVPRSKPEFAGGEETQTDLSESFSMLVPLPSSPSFPVITSVPQPTHVPGRFWKRRRAILLVALGFFLIASAGGWYAALHASAGGAHSLFSPAGRMTPTVAAQRIVGDTPTVKPAALPSSTPQPSPVLSAGTPPAPVEAPTGIPQRTPTPTPEQDCLRGSVSHLTFTSLLGLGNTSPHTVTLTNCGGSTENWFASIVTGDGGDWLSANPAVGTITLNGSVNIQIQAAGAGLQIGTYQGSVTFFKGPAQWTITVAFTILQV